MFDPAPDWPHAFERIVAALPNAARQVYRDRLKALVLFGSVARRTMRPDSDIDLLVVAGPLPSTRLQRNAEFEAVDALLAEELAAAANRGVYTTLFPLIRTPEELERGSFAFFDLPSEGRILYDPEGIAADYCQRLAARLAAQGAERRTFRGAPYWVLKPSACPGEKIPL